MSGFVAETVSEHLASGPPLLGVNYERPDLVSVMRKSTRFVQA